MANPAQEQEQSPCLLDALYCEEEKWEDVDDEQEHEVEENVDVVHNFGVNKNHLSSSSSLLSILLLEQDLFWDDEELISLINKEKKEIILDGDDFSLICARKEAIKWMLKVNSHYGFCTLTSILCVNYFDRFISSFPIHKDKPWTIQLAAVTCLSLAAKVEEIRVPHVLDLQVEGAQPIFEPKVIQKMELLVLSTLDWKMHPITPLSFLNHIIRRLGLKNHLHWEFLKRCERVLLSLLSDWRFGSSYVPSVLATATMMHVIDHIEPCNPLEYHSQLLHVLNISKEKVNDCYELIVESLSGSSSNEIPNPKRKYDQMMMNSNNNNTPVIVPSSPSGVIEAYCFSSDSSNDSWAAAATAGNHSAGTSVSVSSSVSSSPVVIRKRGRVHEQPMPLQLPSLSRVFVDVVGSPR